MGRRLVISLIFLSLGTALFAQTTAWQDTLQVYFKVSDSTLYPEYEDNGTRLSAFAEKVLQGGEHAWVIISSGSSPDGTLKLNTRLTKERSESVRQFLTESLGLSENKFVIDNQPVRWQVLRDQLEASDEPYRDKVLALMDSKPADKLADALKSLGGGKPWADMKKKYFPAMRGTLVIMGFEQTEEEDVVVEDTAVEVVVPEQEERMETVEAPVAPVEVVEPAPQPVLVPVQAPAGDPRAMWVKTNLLAWAAFQMNAAVEFELFNHFTISLPVYYGTFDWFVSSMKFNTLEFRPELRYYLRKECMGPFAAIHGTVGMYNYALGGELRYQDHLGKSPAYGGGLTLGWRFPLKLFGTDRLGLEVAVGAAALVLNYDTFYNVPNGKYFEKDIKKTYYGIDNISVTATYRFDSKRRIRR